MKNKLIIIFWSILMVFTACNNNENEPPEPEEPNFEEKDVLYIEYSNNAVSIDKEIEGVTVKYLGGDIEINSKKEGIKYVLTGSTTGGSFKIYSSHIMEINLDGLTLHNSNGPAINIQSSQPALLTLKAGTTSNLSDGSSYSASDEDMKGCISSIGQINIQGTGEINITGNCKHGISSGTFIRIDEVCTINVTKSVSDAIHSKYDTFIYNGILNLTSSNEGIESKSGKIQIEKADITIVTQGEKSDGLKAEKDITIKSGTIHIVTENAASKAIKTDGEILIEGGNLTLTTKGDAIYEDEDTSSSSCLKSKGNISISDGVINMTSSGLGGKGISTDKDLIISGGEININTTGRRFVYEYELTSSPKAIKTEGNTTISGGELTISTTGGVGAEGIDCKGDLNIQDGTVVVNCSDDCLKSSGNFILSGGDVYCHSEENDGVDSNGTITITGGRIVSVGIASNKEGFNCGKNTFTITGGTIVGIGRKGSTPTESECEQSVVIYKTNNIQKTNLFHIQSTDKKGVFTYRSPYDYSSMVLVMSSPDIKENTDYHFYVGGEITGGNEYYGYFTGGTYTGGNEVTSFTTTQKVTEIP